MLHMDSTPAYLDVHLAYISRFTYTAYPLPEVSEVMEHAARGSPAAKSGGVWCYRAVHGWHSITRCL